MKFIEYSVLITASPLAVFHVIADPRSKLAWVPAIRRVQLETGGAALPGTKYLASSGIGPLEFAYREEIVDWAENRRLAYEGHSPWGDFRTIVTLQPHGEGTWIHYCMEYTCPGGWLGAAVGRIAAFFISRPMGVRASIRLKEVVEKGLWESES